MMKNLDWKIAFSVLFFLCLSGSAEATQVHGNWEGLTSHLIAHLIFFASLIYLCLRLYQGRTSVHSGWSWIFLSAFLFAVWNVQTFYVHVYREYLSPYAFTGLEHNLAVGFQVHSLPALLYYFGRFDHVLFLSALLCLLYGIRFMLHNDGELS
ncbi:MAG: hypothetical protein GXP58_06690 [Deltaproteobacteria bacterium]|nr:hypothetical protein [Deltaproteobacteria bacterium]